MKRTAFALVLLVVGGTLFASGAQENARPAPGATPLRSVSETELTGTYDEIDGFPVIRAGGKTYAAGVPGYRWMDIDLEPGDEITVTGYLFEETEPISGHMRVTSATIDGTEYQVAPVGRSGAGQWGGRRGHRGPHMGGPRGYGQPGYESQTPGAGYDSQTPGPGYGPRTPAPGSGRRW